MAEPTPSHPETHSGPPASAGANAGDAVATLPPSPAGQRPQHLTPVTELVLRWQEAWQRGQPIDTAELCAGTPELRDEVRRHLEALRAMEALLDRLPAADSAATVPPGPADARQTLSQDSVATAAGVQVPGYEILEELGRGGMGVVYKARHIKLNRAVALKMVLAGGHPGSEDRIRFLAEAEAVAALQHANIVQVFEVGQHDSLPFMALEYVNGGSLADRLRHGLPLPREAAWLVEQLAHGMAAAHAKGIIHRDLKPHNVLLRRKSEIQNPKSEKECGLPGSDFGFRISDLEPKITDFGLAKKVAGGSGLTQTGAVMGTPSYMAPEQAEAKKDVGPAADIYALGAILYECLTGRPPFRGATPLDTIMQVVAEEPVSVRQLQPSCPRDLETMCHKCLNKEPAKRYCTALELAEELQRFLVGLPVLARPVGWLERGWRWCRRNPWVAGLVATVALLLVLGAGVASFFAVQSARQAETAWKARQQAEQAADLATAEKREAERQRDRAQRSAYVNLITLAKAEWDHGSAALAWKHLQACQPNLRGWEHDFLATRFNKVPTLHGHTGLITSVAMSADGKRIVSASNDKTMKVWNVEKGTDVLTLKGTHAFNCVAISADGKLIVSGAGDMNNPFTAGEIKVWDANTGTVIRTLKGHADSGSRVAISSDGKRTVSDNQDGTIVVWDVNTGREIHCLKGHTNVNSLAISADGKRIVSSSLYDAGQIRVWDADKGTEIPSIKGDQGFSV